MKFNTEKIEKAKALYEFLYDYMHESSKIFDAKYPTYEVAKSMKSDVFDYIEAKYF